MLRERLLEARTALARFRILESSLLEQMRRTPQRHPAVRYALDEFRSSAGALSVAAVTERTGLSARRFIEVFRREVGLTPKVYSRISRFRAAAAPSNRQPESRAPAGLSAAVVTAAV
jgi:methylphosphotriester-DNA--protein-cysteine methyltransferase